MFSFNLFSVTHSILILVKIFLYVIQMIQQVSFLIQLYFNKGFHWEEGAGINVPLRKGCWGRIWKKFHFGQKECNNLSEYRVWKYLHLNKNLLGWLPGCHCACHQCQEHQEQENRFFSSTIGGRKGPEEFLWDHQLLRTSSTRSWSFAQNKSFRCHANFPHRDFGSRIWCLLNREVQDTQDIALDPGNI